MSDDLPNKATKINGKTKFLNTEPYHISPKTSFKEVKGSQV
jgi:hypothetical protein